MIEESQKERLSVRNSIDELLPLAEAGDPEAQYCLAKKILGDALIRIPPIDQAAGVTWLIAAAQGGHIASQKALAWMYRFVGMALRKTSTGRSAITKWPLNSMILRH